MDTKTKIFEAALKIVCEEGLHRLSYTRLSKECGSSKQLIKYHFPALSDLLLELFSRTADAGREITEAMTAMVDDPTAKLLAMAQAMMQWAASDSNNGRYFLLMYHLAPTHEKILSIHQKTVNTGLQRIKVFLYEMMKFKNKQEVEVRAAAIHSLMIGTLFRMVSLDDFEHSEIYTSEMELGINAILEGSHPRENTTILNL